ncbi:MAG: DUF4157 domain-containing protein [Chloroflexi bacterium]|nr:DUF4157 domain-containing protein [Chloroflexota bacterium]
MSNVHAKSRPKTKGSPDHHTGSRNGHSSAHQARPATGGRLGPFYAAGPVFGLAQTKLVVGRVNDPYEREADAVAERVTSGTPAPAISRIGPAGLGGVGGQGSGVTMYLGAEEPLQETAVQRQEEEPVQELAVQRQAEQEEPIQQAAMQGQEEEAVQELAVQRQEEEPVQELAVQRQEEEPVQELAIQRQETKEEPVQEVSVQRQEMPEEEGVQRQAMAEEEPTQRQAQPEEETAQRQAAAEDEAVQSAGDGSPHVTPATAATIRNPGMGQPMSPAVRRRIEPHIGADLSGVRVHIGASAHRAANTLQARAFTNRNHIFLNSAESSGNVRLMAHEATHVVQQGAALVQRMAQISPAPEQIQRLPAFITDRLASYARHIPGYTLFTVIIGFNPLTASRVERTPMNLVEGLMGLVPFGTAIFDKLRELGILQRAFDWIEGELARFDLSLDRLERLIQEAWDEMDFIRLDPFDYNVGVLTRKFSGLLNDVRGFARSLVDTIIELIKEAALGVAEQLLAENRAWALIKKILHHDPLRDVPVEATTVEILEDFLMLIGKEQELAQMRERGTLQETADWLDTQVATFMGLLGELRGLITAAWETIQPENLPNLTTNLRDLAGRAFGFLQRVWDFAVTVAAKVLELIKKALLSWLSSFAHEVPGFHLVTVILGRNPFTGEEVPRTAENIIRGFITLLPGGNEQYARLQETGVIGQAAARIEGAMSELGISWEFITGLFLGIWNSLTIEDLIDPIGAFRRIRDQFGEPISRLFAFIRVVIEEIFKLILQLMNFPTDILASIITNAMQAVEDIKRDPVGFFKNMLQAVKLGFTRFFDNILQHLISGLAEWLFRGLRSAGIEPPTEITLESILGLVLQVLGLSMEHIWEKLAEHLGRETVDRIRRTIDRLTGIWNFIRDVQERGVAAIWEYIESQISNLWDMVLEQARNWIMETIIQRVTARLLSMLDPTGIMAVVNSFIAFFNAVQSAIEYLREILEIVNDYVTTIAAVARGEIEPGAQKMEQGLANAIPIAIGFLANQVGLGNIGEKIQEIIAGLRGLVDRALDWLIERAISLGRSVLRALGLGGEAAEGAAGAAEGQLEKDFMDSEGSPHELTVTLTGAQPDIRVASPAATGVQHQIEDRRNAETDATNPRPLTPQQKGALTRAWNQHDELVTLSRDYLRADDTQKPELHRQIQALMDSLAANMVRGDAWPDTEIQPTQVTFSSAGGNKQVTANPLTRRPGNTVGSAAEDVIPGWQANVGIQTAGRGGTLPWRRVHLLSDRLHGPGSNPANLIPAQEITNGEMRRGPEREAYERITRGETLEYTARVTGADPNNSFFPAGVLVTVTKIAPGDRETVFDRPITTAPAPTGAGGPQLTPTQASVVDTYERLEASLGRRPTQAEVATARGLSGPPAISMTITQIRELLRTTPQPHPPELQRAARVLGL